MNTGINQHGYRWTIEDHSARRKGFAAVVWTADQGDAPKSVVGRSGFASREDALAWVNEYEGRAEQKGEALDGRAIAVFGLFGVMVVSMMSLAVLRLWIVGRALRQGAGVRYTTRVQRDGKVEREFSVGPR